MLDQEYDSKHRNNVATGRREQGLRLYQVSTTDLISVRELALDSHRFASSPSFGALQYNLYKSNVVGLSSRILENTQSVLMRG